MSDPLHVQILDALMARLSTPALTTPATDIAWPNVTFTPTPGKNHLVARPILRAEPDAMFHAHDGEVIHRGIFQVDAVVPDAAGEGPGLRLAALVAARFVSGTAFDIEAGRLKILQPPAIAAAIRDVPWVRYPVSIAYFMAAPGS